jgi:uncharacterized small protein (DUF1192 family)
MRIEHLEKRASDKERPSSNRVSLENQKLAELLRSRIEELDQRLAILKSENEKSSAPLEKPLDGVRRMDDTHVVATPLTAINGWLWLKN